MNSKTLFKKGLSLVLCAFMCLSTVTPAFAVTVDDKQNNTSSNITVDDGSKPLEENNTDGQKPIVPEKGEGEELSYQYRT